MMGKDTITRSIRLRLNSPVDAKWEEVNPELFALRSVSHQLLQAAILEEVIAAHEKRKPDRLVALKRELAVIKEKTKREAVKQMKPSSKLTDAIQTRARQAAQNYLAKRFKEPMRIPSARYPAPIYVRDGGWTLEINGKLTIAIKLRGGRGEWHRFTCAPLKGPHWAIVRSLAAGETTHKPGDLKLIYDERKDRKTGRKRGWEVTITVTSPRPEAMPGNGVAAIHRGQRNFVTVVTTAGGYYTFPGTALKTQKERLAARRRSIQQARNELGSRGRGRARRGATGLKDKESRVVRTACQQAAAFAIQRALRHECGTVVREDYGGIAVSEDRYLPRFPYFQLGQAIDWAATKNGCSTETVPAEYVSTTCLRCGVRDERSHNTRTGVFHCHECGFERDADFVAAIHMLRRSGADMSVWDGRFRKLEELAATARRGV